MCSFSGRSQLWCWLDHVCHSLRVVFCDPVNRLRVSLRSDFFVERLCLRVSFEKRRECAPATPWGHDSHQS